MSHRITHSDDREAKSFGEAEASLSRPAGETRRPNILVHQMPSSAAASDVSGDAGGHEEDSFASLGSLAVRLVASWSLPRMSLVPARAGEEIRPSQRPVTAREDRGQDQ